MTRSDREERLSYHGRVSQLRFSASSWERDGKCSIFETDGAKEAHFRDLKIKAEELCDLAPPLFYSAEMLLGLD